MTMPEKTQPIYAEHHADNQRRFTALERKLDANTEATERLAADTQELLDMFRTAKGGFRVMGWLGSTVKTSGKTITG